MMVNFAGQRDLELDRKASIRESGVDVLRGGNWIEPSVYCFMVVKTV